MFQWLLAIGLVATDMQAGAVPTVKVVAGGESAVPATQCRRMLVGPSVNQPAPYPGYHGFVGWQCPARLKDGTLLVSFSTGYWHASPPTPLKVDPGEIETWKKMGFPSDVVAPTGGRAMLIRSSDGGRSWTKPQTIIDTPWDDRSPAIVELPGGTLLCSFFLYSGERPKDKGRMANRTAIVRSFDGGKSWEQTPKLLPSPFVADATDGPPILLKDGSVVLAVYGASRGGGQEQVGVFRTADRGESWQFLSVVKADHELSETGIAQLPDGRLVMIARPEGDIAWSADGGRTWTPPKAFGMRMFEPGLVVLHDGTLLCIHGSYGAGGQRVIFSTDGGQTWIAPAKDHGFAIDTSVYGYGRGVELPDGSVFAAYIHTGGHSRHDAETEAIWGVRLRVRPDHSGIDLLPASRVGEAGERFSGRFYQGEGDAQYLQLLEIAARMFAPDPELQNIAMFYTPEWNGLVEGPTWDAWWIQNSYGPTYCMLPFSQEPLTTFLENSQDLWFDQMGDGHSRRSFSTFTDWIPPDGCLCDAAKPGQFIAKQGDGRVDLHDWCMEFTAAGVVMQAELLLIGRDAQAIEHYLPKLRRSADFIETRRDPRNNLFLAGPAGNLLAPSYAGWKKADGTYGQAYLAGLSVTYIAALDRLIELEKLAGNPEGAKRYSQRRDLARRGLPLLTTDEGYFIKSLDPDGTRHGVYGAAKHGYFEAVANHDAVCFRVADDAQAEKIYAKIASIPGLRPHDLIITNHPGLDDMYVPAAGLWEFGTWVNGGHWSTCEARAIMGYYRLGKYDDARRSMTKMLDYARRFRMDNPLVDFGNAPYQSQQPINCVYDNWGVPAAMIRGLFEYLYRADGLTILPHIPSRITRLEQHFPIRFGRKQLYLATAGQGPITGVLVNGQAWTAFNSQSVSLPYAQTPDEAVIEILLGGAKREPFMPRKAEPPPSIPQITGLLKSPPSQDILALASRVAVVQAFHQRLVDAGLGQSYEAAHARLAVDYFAATALRLKMLAENKLPLLPSASQAAADQSYLQTTTRLCEGLKKTLASYEKSHDPRKQRVWRLWSAVFLRATPGSSPQ